MINSSIVKVMSNNLRGMWEERAENGRDSAAQWMVERVTDALGEQSDATNDIIKDAALRIMADDDAADEARRV